MAKQIRVLALLGALAVLLVACNRDSPRPQPSPSAAPSSAGQSSPTSFRGVLVEVTVAGGKVQVDRRTVEAKVGDNVRIQVTADVQDEVHVHGYDLRTSVVPGQPSQLDFVASIPGTFEVELEKAKLELFRLQVS